jgi:hypothetical protein
VTPADRGYELQAKADAANGTRALLKVAKYSIHITLSDTLSLVGYTKDCEPGLTIELDAYPGALVTVLQGIIDQV